MTFEFPNLFETKRPSTALDALHSEVSKTELEQETRDLASKGHSVAASDSVEVESQVESAETGTTKKKITSKHDAEPSGVKICARDPPKWFSR